MTVDNSENQKLRSITSELGSDESNQTGDDFFDELNQFSELETIQAVTEEEDKKPKREKDLT